MVSIYFEYIRDKAAIGRQREISDQTARKGWDCPAFSGDNQFPFLCNLCMADSVTVISISRLKLLLLLMCQFQGNADVA